ncbi:hypothetical protein GCM10022207_16910 [Streptomyces lannensis]|uniref:Uncharacterized protein n=1 Tax=Streptomyces lannensis TaxID=766498 RepID=A0ABP7JTR5_9ACTN
MAGDDRGARFAGRGAVLVPAREVLGGGGRGLECPGAGQAEAGERGVDVQGGYADAVRWRGRQGGRAEPLLVRARGGLSGRRLRGRRGLVGALQQPYAGQEGYRGDGRYRGVTDGAGLADLAHMGLLAR